MPKRQIRTLLNRVHLEGHNERQKWARVCDFAGVCMKLLDLSLEAARGSVESLQE